MFLDAAADDSPPGGFCAALDAPCERLRVAVSFKPPPRSLGRLTEEGRVALEQTAELLRSLGHDVFEQKVEYGFKQWPTSRCATPRVSNTIYRRWLVPDQLERNTRRLGALARLIPQRSLTAARQRGGRSRNGLDRSFERTDVVLTPTAGVEVQR